jgi:hypothetical protein
MATRRRLVRRRYALGPRRPVPDEREAGGGWPAACVAVAVVLYWLEEHRDAVRTVRLRVCAAATDADWRGRQLDRVIFCTFLPEDEALYLYLLRHLLPRSIALHATDLVQVAPPAYDGPPLPDAAAKAMVVDATAARDDAGAAAPSLTEDATAGPDAKASMRPGNTAHEADEAGPPTAREATPAAEPVTKPASERERQRSPEPTSAAAPAPAHDNAVPAPTHVDAASVPTHVDAASVPAHVDTAPVPAHDNAVPVPAHDNAVPAPMHDDAASAPMHDDAAPAPAAATDNDAAPAPAPADDPALAAAPATAAANDEAVPMSLDVHTT